MALELVKGFSTQSYISQRLWKSIKSLRKLGPQLGLSHEHQQQQQQHQGDNTLDDVPASSTVHTTPLDGTQMTQELMEWFETVGNLDTLMAMGIPGTNTGVEDGLAMLDYGGELSSVMKDCF